MECLGINFKIPASFVSCCQDAFKNKADNISTHNPHEKEWLFIEDLTLSGKQRQVLILRDIVRSHMQLFIYLLSVQN